MGEDEAGAALAIKEHRERRGRAQRYVHLTSIPLKNSEIEVPPKSHLPANIVAFTGSCRCKGYQRVARRKTGRFAGPYRNFHRGRQRFSEL
jgi:hypothetical protein